MRSSNACPMGTGSDFWHTKPTEEETLLFPLQFDSSTGHDQPSELPLKKSKHFMGIHIVQELCESQGGRPGLSVLTSLLVSVDVKLY